MVTNAGGLRYKDPAHTTDDDFDAVVNSRLRETFTCGRAAVARFRVQGDGGRLILVGSPAGHRASFGQGSYSVEGPNHGDDEDLGGRERQDRRGGQRHRA
ncbi:SDR family NAD(P)-dependent oxidoreductase [Gordonia terrae]